jgi:hypothetical protein
MSKINGLRFSPSSQNSQRAPILSQRDNARTSASPQRAGGSDFDIFGRTTRRVATDAQGQPSRLATRPFPLFGALRRPQQAAGRARRLPACARDGQGAEWSVTLSLSLLAPQGLEAILAAPSSRRRRACACGHRSASVISGNPGANRGTRQERAEWRVDRFASELAALTVKISRLFSGPARRLWVGMRRSR